MLDERKRKHRSRRMDGVEPRHPCSSCVELVLEAVHDVVGELMEEVHELHWRVGAAAHHAPRLPPVQGRPLRLGAMRQRRR